MSLIGVPCYDEEADERTGAAFLDSAYSVASPLVRLTVDTMYHEHADNKEPFTAVFIPSSAARELGKRLIMAADRCEANNE